MATHSIQGYPVPPPSTAAYSSSMVSGYAPIPSGGGGPSGYPSSANGYGSIKEQGYPARYIAVSSTYDGGPGGGPPASGEGPSLYPSQPPSSEWQSLRQPSMVQGMGMGMGMLPPPSALLGRSSGGEQGYYDVDVGAGGGGYAPRDGWDGAAATGGIGGMSGINGSARAPPLSQQHQTNVGTRSSRYPTQQPRHHAQPQPPSYASPSAGAAGVGGEHDQPPSAAPVVKRSHKKNAGHPITHAHGQDEDDPSAQPAHQQRGSASDFIKKIYMMLTYPELLIDKIKSSGAGEGGAGGEEGGGGASVKTEFSVEWLKGIVDWQDDGMKFRVKQIPLFTEWILPSLFRHCNFASFVRQLNKYGFNKVQVKYTSSRVEPGDARRVVWEFEREGFYRGGENVLDLIKRKVSVAKKKGGVKSSDDELSDEEEDPSDLRAQLEEVQAHMVELERRVQANDVMLEASRQEVSVLRQREEARDAFWPQLVGYGVGLERHLAQSNVNQPSPAAMNLIASFNQMMRAFGSVEQVDARLIFPPYGISPQSHPSSFPSPGNCNGNATPDVPLLQNMMDVVDGGAMTAPLMVPAGSNGTEASLLSGSDMGMQGGGGFQMTMINGGGRSNNSPADGSGCSGSGGNYGGLSAHDQLSIAPDNGGQDAEADARNAGEDAGDDADTSNGGESADDTDDLIVPAADEHGQLIAVQRKKHQPKGNVRRTKGHQVFPAWSAAPRVLVVEDNIVSRKLSARILQLIGCNIETAVNGQEAVAKMGSGKYDLCLMDINMPSLSGVDATTRIRSFDINTPIISMSSTTAPNAVAGYLSVGMTDYLPKPFNKNQLFNMLQKHLHHMLNNFRRLSHQIPPVVGMPPLSDNGITEAVAHAAAAVTPASFDAHGNLHLGQNPLAAMGISDDVYAGMVQSFYSTNGVLGDNNGGSLANFAMYPQSGAGLPFLGQFDASNGGSGGGEGGGNGQKRKAGDFENEWDDSKRIRVEELP